MPNRKLQIKFSPKRFSEIKKTTVNNVFEKEIFDLEFIKDLDVLQNSKNVAGFFSNELTKESIKRKFDLKLNIK